MKFLVGKVKIDHSDCDTLFPLPLWLAARGSGALPGRAGFPPCQPPLHPLQETLPPWLRGHRRERGEVKPPERPVHHSPYPPPARLPPQPRPSAPPARGDLSRGSSPAGVCARSPPAVMAAPVPVCWECRAGQGGEGRTAPAGHAAGAARGTSNTAARGCTGGFDIALDYFRRLVPTVIFIFYKIPVCKPKH